MQAGAGARPSRTTALSWSSAARCSSTSTDPAGALDRLAELAQPWLIASVPREPLWRALNLFRFTYVSMLGNTPGHVNHWSKRGFARFLERRFEVVELRSPLPWTMALCRAR